MQLILDAKATIQNEIAALQKMSEAIGNQFSETVALLLACQGRIVITGIGKSAIIAQKIVATFNSTGTPAIFMHAADAIHGDLGMVQNSDIVLIISKSGESPEIKALIPLLKNFGNKIIAICGNHKSSLAQEADYFLDTSVDMEACPNNLAPTTSTTAQLVMGDCLAVCLLKSKGFSAKDFAKYHPGGSLGKQLYLTAQNLSSKNERPCVAITASLDEVIIEMTSKTLGATAVLDQDKLVGIITDGDLRRMLQNKSISNALITAADIVTKNAKTVDGNTLAVKALEIMREHDITQLIVLDNGLYAGMIHLHDFIKEGII